MDKIRIIGGSKLKGEIPIGGAKNAALPLMATSLLTDEPLVLSNLPHLTDVSSLAHLLAQHGVSVSFDGHNSEAHGHLGRVIRLQARDIIDTTAPYELVRKMRASILVLGPLLARTGRAKVSLPGGCAIGTRPIDFHINGLIAMGAEIAIENGYIIAKAPHGLTGSKITMPLISVTATENLIMAASLAKGTTEIINAACEPEISDLTTCLQSMGVAIEGIGTNRLIIEGKKKLSGAHHRILPDRIETGTYAIAAAITRGEIELLGTSLDLIPTFSSVLESVGVELKTTSRGIKVKANDSRPKNANVTTQPYPGFATDLQAQVMTLLALGDGVSYIRENIFENRFMHVSELCRMGANITVQGNTAIVRGVKMLKGAEVMATDLRASVSLVLAGLIAEGETIVNRVYHLDRGYERIEDKLCQCGANIERIRDIEGPDVQPST
jgi:UDP-N-acetylglucosamine 1-carboxyvinyltransferase